MYTQESLCKISDVCVYTYIYLHVKDTNDVELKKGRKEYENIL